MHFHCHLLITGTVGRESEGLWSLRIESDVQTLVDETNLACDPDFGSLAWLGFSSTAKRPNRFYLDNIRFEDVTESEHAAENDKAKVK
jgi:hypothetical protein